MIILPRTYATVPNFFVKFDSPIFKNILVILQRYKKIIYQHVFSQKYVDILIKPEFKLTK